MDGWVWIPDINPDWIDLRSFAVSFPAFLQSFGLTSDYLAKVIVEAFNS